MKITRTKSLIGLALTCFALAGPSSLFAAATNFVVSTFDSDLSANPYGTNYWNDSSATSLTWTNAGNPAGSMHIVLDWAQGTSGGSYEWEESQIHCRPWDASTNADRGLDLRYYQSLDFDAMVLTNVSTTNLHGDYAGMNIALLGDPWWGSNPTNGGIPWTGIGGAAPVATVTNGGWQHYSLQVLPFQGTVSEFVFQCYNWGNSNTAMHTEFLIDNIKLIAASGPGPTMQYTKATRGLNIWPTTGGTDRNTIRSYQDPASPTYYMWAGNGAASYSFTIGAYPVLAPTDTNAIRPAVRLELFPTLVTSAAADWDAASCIMTEIQVDTNGYATWMFHWKTNAPGGNGDLYTTDAQIFVTNPTPVGKWTLSFANDQNVTMTTPSGNSTNFVMGVHANVPDISPAFVESSGNYGEVYLGLFGGGTNVGNPVVFSGAQISGGNIYNSSNNWLTATTFNTNEWVAVGTPPYTLVPTNNAMWLNWNVPDAGFFLETNTVQPGATVNWSTNHGLPYGTIYVNHRGTLVKPGDLPNTPKLYFRMNSNPQQ
jgi:hypothetical protein